MDKSIKVYKYVDGVNDTPFPNADTQIIISEYSYNAKRMGGTPTITATISHPLCLDNLWDKDKVYVKFNDERYYIKQVPSSSYSNTDVRYIHEATFISEREILNNVYFFDVVTDDGADGKPVSNSTTFSFYGNIQEFASRLNHSFKYTMLDYSVVVDEGVTSENKMLSFSDQFIANVLQEIYNTYEIPYYFIGKEIHIGFAENEIDYVFKYGIKNSLLSINKNNSNYKIINRISGIGSADNIPYYYPNEEEKGVSRGLYNGEADIVSIIDKKKYKSVKLSDILDYRQADSYTKILNDGKDYEITNEFVETSSHIWELVDTIYPFSIDMMRDTDFMVSYDLPDLRYISIKIYKNDELLTSVNKNGSFSRRYGQGDYEMRVSIGIYSEQQLDKSYAQTIIANTLVNIKQDIIGYAEWHYNDSLMPVDLADYGLAISTTPINGDKITFERVSYIIPQQNLMPPKYRETNGAERFYNALNNTYEKEDGSGEYYDFPNPYTKGSRSEHIITLDDIKPSIVGMTNADGFRIDEILEFAYDENDNDEFDDEGNYLHPYFFAKLRKFNGEFGFNLFEHSIEEDEMIISMQDGACGACNFTIGVSDDSQKNTVQVDEGGNLKRDSNGKVLFGSPQDRQNDTQNYEVWIALKKDIDTFGVIMPNAENNYKPKPLDKFVILHIDLPQAYILDAENRLMQEIIKYMAENNAEKFNFSVAFSRIFFEENPTILAQLNENSKIKIEYNGVQYALYISSYSYSMRNDSPLPEITIELSDTITISQNALANAISEVKASFIKETEILNAKSPKSSYLRSDVNDRAKGLIASDKGFEVGNYIRDLSGGLFYYDETTKQSVLEIDRLYLRVEAIYKELLVAKTTSLLGKKIMSKGGQIKCIKVVDRNTNEDGSVNVWDYYRCYFTNNVKEQKIANIFEVDDLAYYEVFNAKTDEVNNLVNKRYWRLVVGVGENYIDLSKTDCEEGSDVPEAGDTICHLGNKTKQNRQSAFIFEHNGSFAPRIVLYSNIDTYSLENKQVIDFGYDATDGKSYLNISCNFKIGGSVSNLSYSKDNGLIFNGILAKDTKLSDGVTTIEDAISNAKPQGYDDFVKSVNESIKAINNTLNNDVVLKTFLFTTYEESEGVISYLIKNDYLPTLKSGNGITISEINAKNKTIEINTDNETFTFGENKELQIKIIDGGIF